MTSAQTTTVTVGALRRALADMDPDLPLVFVGAGTLRFGYRGILQIDGQTVRLDIGSHARLGGADVIAPVGRFVADLDAFSACCEVVLSGDLQVAATFPAVVMEVTGLAACADSPGNDAADQTSTREGRSVEIRTP